MLNVLRLLLVAAVALLVICTGQRYTTGEGYVTCDGLPVPFVKVQLKDKGLIFHDKMAESRTDGKGKFRLTGKGKYIFNGKPEPFVRVEYQYSGLYGEMDVVNAVKINRADSTSARKYARNINFGNINFKNIYCKSYITFYNALEDFRNRAGINLPVKVLHIQTGTALHGGAAYALINTIKIPNSYSLGRITDRMAKHELAHIARHSMDGNFAHFAYDASRFWYLRNHHCGTKSNDGYAFNEGWAEFWANDCHGIYGSKLTDYQYEGNVAKALRRLKSACKSSDPRFIALLKSNKEKIHSFSSFNQKHQSRYMCSI